MINQNSKQKFGFACPGGYQRNFIDIINKVGKFIIARTAEDYEYWLRALKHTDSIYVEDICFYYDDGHGDGQKY